MAAGNDLAVTARAAAKSAGLSDDQEDDELFAQLLLRRAVTQMRDAIGETNRRSALVKVDAGAFEDFVADEIPDEAHWDEKIAAARWS